MRLSDYIVQRLENEGIKAAFLLSGGGMMHLLDAVGKSEKIKYVCNHHEQASGIAADAYSRVSGKMGLCLVTSGPGATNALTAVVGAYQDSTPVIFLSGQSKSSQTIQKSKIKNLRQYGTFEVDIVPIVESVTKYAVTILEPKSIRYHLEKAIYLAKNGRPGPVWIDLPVDLQGALINIDELVPFDESELNSNTHHSINDEVYAYIYEKISSAKKPLIIAGHGVKAANAVSLFRAFTKTLNIPVVSTCFANDALEYENPLFVGHPGVKGDRAGNFAIQDCDLLLSIGNSFHVTTTGYEIELFSPGSFKIMVDLDQSNFSRQEIKIDFKVETDTVSFISGFMNYLGTNKTKFNNESWIKKCLEWKQKFQVYRENHLKEKNKMNYYEVIEYIDNLSADDDVIVTDAGSAFYVIGHAFKVKKNQFVVNSGSLGAMGFALPAATGAALAKPDKRILCVTGDGSLQTNLHELSVFKENNLNIKLFVINNNGYVSIRNTQNNFFSGHIVGASCSTGVKIPDLSLISKSLDLRYYSIHTREELSLIADKINESEGPIVFEVFTNENQQIIPSVSSRKLDNGKMQSMPLDKMYPFLD